MKTCQYAGASLGPPRSHPWTDAATNHAYRYYDFKAEPHLIRTALEDLVPWSHYPAIKRLYDLLEQLNAPSSPLESNDCAFCSPHETEAPQQAKALQCDGRLMLLFRKLEHNQLRHHTEQLTLDLHRRLANIDREFEWGMLGTTIPRVRYIGLPGTADEQLGFQLLISFWAWGDSEAETMGNLDRVVQNLTQALTVALRPADQPIDHST